MKMVELGKSLERIRRQQDAEGFVGGVVREGDCEE
jgi:hypothetical protein